MFLLILFSSRSQHLWSFKFQLMFEVFYIVILLMPKALPVMAWFLVS